MVGGGVGLVRAGGSGVGLLRVLVVGGYLLGGVGGILGDGSEVCEDSGGRVTMMEFVVVLVDMV